TTSPQTGTHADQLGQRQPGQAAAQRLGSGHAQGVEPVGGAGAVADRAAPRDAQHADRLGRSGGRLGGGGLARLQAAGGLLSADAVVLAATATIGTVATVDLTHDEPALGQPAGPAAPRSCRCPPPRTRRSRPAAQPTPPARRTRRDGWPPPPRPTGRHAGPTPPRSACHGECRPRPSPTPHQAPVSWPWPPSLPRSCGCVAPA